MLDGIYIKYGAYNYEDLPKKKFRKYFKAIVIMQLLESIIMGVIIIAFIGDGNRVFILLSVILNMMLINIATLFSFIHQFTKRVKLFSVNLILTKLIFIIGCIALFISHIYQYKFYIWVQTLANIIVLVIYVFYNKELVFGKSEKVFENLNEYKELFIIGFSVMIGNLMSSIIVGLDRIIVDRYFTTNEFSMYSFAYTLVTLFYILLNAITMVIYPYLARSKKSELTNMYGLIKDGLIIITSIMISGYFVLELIVIKVLPKYIDSLNILKLLIPTIILSAQINILISNMYKVLKLKKDYPKNNIFALGLGIVTNVIAYLIFKTTVSIAAATLISFIIWLLYSDVYFEKELNIDVKRSNIIQGIIIAIFLITVYTLPLFIGFIIYVISVGVILLLSYRKRIKDILELVLDK